jgi:hypothetical protein
VSQSRDELLARITEEEARLTAIEKQRRGAQQRLRDLQQELATLSDISRAEPCRAPALAGAVPKTAATKVRLFRTLFRGRTDIFPNRFVSKRTGKAGYAPACSNKFVPGVCELPKVKCGECPNQAFQPVDDRAIINHLQGRHIMGVYPLLEDDTCWFLAADFDKESWKDDVAAFVETCRAVGVPVSVERSRSGHGAHVWFFFAAPVAAATARKMGCHLVTETMSAHHQLSMQSYDRLFPNQDTMPRGGFGNLIALPLQHEARKRGNADDLARPRRLVRNRALVVSNDSDRICWSSFGSPEGSFGLTVGPSPPLPIRCPFPVYEGYEECSTVRGSWTPIWTPGAGDDPAAKLRTPSHRDLAFPLLPAAPRARGSA